MILIRGAGDLASGVALRLYRSGYDSVLLETHKPSAVRRTVSFSEAVYRGETRVEELGARLAKGQEEACHLLKEGVLPVLIDPEGDCITSLKPRALIDARLCKYNPDTHKEDAPVVIALGPGYEAGVDCHGVVETMRGHCLGRVYYSGRAIANTGVPGVIGGYSLERLLRAPREGRFIPLKEIGDRVEAGETVAAVDGIPIQAQISGILRGLLPCDYPVYKGMKSGDIDPRCEREHCYQVSDKALSIGGAVLEALLHYGIYPDKA